MIRDREHVKTNFKWNMVDDKVIRAHVKTNLETNMVDDKV